MGKPTGFMEYARRDAPKRPIEQRVRDSREIEQSLPSGQVETQAARCMECGIPFCHTFGCPVDNLIPDWNDMVYRGRWQHALRLLHATNNLPEITGRICPAPCEPACTLTINQPAVTIRQLELEIVERGWQEGWIQARPPALKSGRRIAVVGSGPAGLAAAQQLARSGHEVVLFESADRIGGILRYGIPDFKLEKWVIDRRLEQMGAEGVIFEPGVTAGYDLSIRYLRRSFAAVLLSGGARVPRDLEAPGRQFAGTHMAMDFLTQQNRRVAGDTIPEAEAISAAGKDVVVIGGGDTGSDCVGTSVRQGAASITQLEIMPRPPDEPAASTPWPLWPLKLRTSSSHEEGCERHWSVLSKEIYGDDDGRVKGLRVADVTWSRDGASGRMSFGEAPGSERDIPGQLILLAMGFTREGNAATLSEFGVATVADCTAELTDGRMTNLPGVFVAGDLAKGASLVVRAITDGRQAADGVNKYLANRGPRS